MKRIALALTLLVVMASAADVYMFGFGKGWGPDSIYNFWNDIPASRVYIDTITYHAEDGLTTLDLGSKYYNGRFRSLNGAGDSGYVKISFDFIQGISHNDSVAVNYTKQSVGLNSADDYLYVPFQFKYIYIWPTVSGTADSTCLLEILYMR